MSKYLSDCDLRGYRPKNCYGETYNVRNKLISKMLADRNVVRVISAPNGYGKSILSCQYAEMIFGFKDVLWIQCENPCFLRDLDSAEILSYINRRNNTNLVVFDNLVYLHEERSVKFNKLISELLGNNIEVIVNYVPLSAPALPLEKDCLFILAGDLLASVYNSNQAGVYFYLSDIGVASETSTTWNSRFWYKNIADNIPMFRYTKENKYSKILKENIDTDLPLGLNFCIFYIYACQSGYLDALKQIVSKADFTLFLEYIKGNPHIVVEPKQNVFSVPFVELEDIKEIFGNNLEKFSRKYFGKTTELWANIIDNACAANNYSRAFDISQILMKTDFTNNLIEQYLLESMFNLQFPPRDIQAADMHNFENNPNTVSALFVWNYYLTGRFEEAKLLAYKILESSTNPTLGIICALLFYVCGNSKDRENSYKLISCFSNACEESNNELSSLAKLSGMLILNSNSINSFSNILKDISKMPDGESFLLMAALLLIIIKHNTKLAYDESCEKLITKGISYCVKSWIVKPALGKYLFAKNLVNSDALFLNIWNIDIDQFNEIKRINKLLSELVRDEILKVDSRALEVSADDSQIKKSENSKIQDYFSDAKITSNNVQDVIAQMHNEIIVPPLTINLFSKFEIFIGDYEVPTRNISRKKVKTLLAVLILHSGQDISIEEVAKIIWPKSNEKSALSNLNCCWVYAKKLLCIDGKNCPYLMRMHKGFAIDSSNVNSDIYNVDLLFEKFTLDDVDPKEWVLLARKNMDVIKGELMPGESGNEFIIRQRLLFKSKILDALTCATERLCDNGYYREALWFGRLAFDLDPYREDVYRSLMLAQYRSGNRSSAIDTYFACEKMLKEEHREEMSKSTREMHDQILAETL